MKSIIEFPGWEKDFEIYSGGACGDHPRNTVTVHVNRAKLNAARDRLLAELDEEERALRMVMPDDGCRWVLVFREDGCPPPPFTEHSERLDEI